MDIENYEKACCLRQSISELEEIIERYEKSHASTDVNEHYPAEFVYRPAGYGTVSSIIPDIVYDDIIEVLKTRRDQLQKEFEEL